MKISDFSKQNADATREDVMNQYEQLKDLPQDELSRRLYEEVARQKHNGTFDYKKLEQMLEQIRPYLPEQNYQSIKRILDSLK